MNHPPTSPHSTRRSTITTPVHNNTSSCLLLLLDYHDEQDENISGPAEQDQNHENVCVMGATKNQHVAKARGGSQDHDQNSSKNSSKNYGQDGHPK